MNGGIYLAEQALKRDIWFYFTAFLLFSFVGWFFETFAVLIFNHSFTFRGYLFEGPKLGTIFSFLHSFPTIASLPIIWGMPMIEMYGFGGLIILLIFKKPNHSTFKVFIVGVVALTAFEYVGSLFCQYVVGKVYWDYTTNFMNFQGRICLSSSIGWGFLSILAVNYLEPLVESYYLIFRKRIHFHVVTTLLLLAMICCAAYKYL